MLGNQYQTPASARPKYALGALNGTAEGGNPLKKAAILVLMACAGGLFLVLPDRDQEVLAIEADTAAAAPQATIIDDETTGSTFVREVSSGSAADDAATAQVAVATEAALAGMEHNLQSGLALSSANELMEGARAAAAGLQTPSTTAAPAPATSAPVTAAASEDSTTSEAPTTTAPDTSTSDSSTDGETTDSSGDTTTTSRETTDSSGETTTSVGTETTAAPETTVPPTTVAETTTAPAGNGWVDTGNGVLVPPVLLEIRFCESRGDYTAANPSSSARGGYQFLTGSWAAYGHRDRYGVAQAHLATPAQQDEAALLTWERDGTRPWNASRHCWG